MTQKQQMQETTFKTIHELMCWFKETNLYHNDPFWISNELAVVTVTKIFENKKILQNSFLKKTKRRWSKKTIKSGLMCALCGPILDVAKNYADKLDFDVKFLAYKATEHVVEVLMADPKTSKSKALKKILNRS